MLTANNSSTHATVFDIEFDRSAAHPLSTLCEILNRSIKIRGLYSRACRQTDGIPWRPLHKLCDRHLKEQDRLIGLLRERLQSLGLDGRRLPPAGNSRCSGHSLAPEVTFELPMLARLMDAHDDVLARTQAARHLTTFAEERWTREVAVGHVVLSNQLQRWSLEEYSAIPTHRAYFTGSSIRGSIYE